MQVSFTAPSNSGDSPITDYDVEYSVDPLFPAGAGTFFEGGTTTLSYVRVSGLTNGTTYYFRVRAQNALGTLTGAWSGVSNGAVPYALPGSPSLSGRAVAGNAVSLSAVAPSANGSPITDYVWQYKISTSTSASWLTFADGVSTSTTVTVTGLVNSTTYEFRVCAVNAAGCGTVSSLVSVKAADVPRVPTSVSAAFQAPGTIRVSFTPPTSTGGSAVTDYDVEYSTDPAFAAGSGTFFEGSTTTTNYLDVTGLTYGVVYYFRVKAQNSVGSGNWSSASNAAHG